MSFDLLPDVSILTRVLDMPVLPRLLASTGRFRSLLDREVPRPLRWLVRCVLTIVIGALMIAILVGLPDRRRTIYREDHP